MKKKKREKLKYWEKKLVPLLLCPPISRGKSGTGTGFLSKYFGYPHKFVYVVYKHSSYRAENVYSIIITNQLMLYRGRTIQNKNTQ